MASCVEHLVKSGLVDASRVGIIGGNAGGYAVLRSMCRYPDIWAGGISLYRVSDVKKPEENTHKFESRYMENLVLGSVKYADPVSVCRERSQLYHAEKIAAPLLLLQGVDDPVVRLAQASEMAEVLKNAGRDVMLVVFEGEGHGFTKELTLCQEKVEELLWWHKTLVRLPPGQVHD